MIRFLVTVNFTRNGIADQAVIGTVVIVGTSAVAAMTVGVNAVTALLEAKAAFVGDTIVIGTTSVVLA